MEPIQNFPANAKKQIRYILTDIDDTLTNGGRLYSIVFAAMERLRSAGIRIVPITGRPAGWCDHIARMWPVDAVVGENGAFYFHYDEQCKKMVRRYWKSEKDRRSDRRKLDAIEKEILRQVPGCRISADQAYREADLAIDFCEDVPPLPMKDVHRIVDCFTGAGAQAKISSIHVNGWFGEYDKLRMTGRLFDDLFESSLSDLKPAVVFIGDSPNDAPMFSHFPNAVGVANLLAFENQITDLPAWITRQEGGFGFAEMVDVLLG